MANELEKSAYSKEAIKQRVRTSSINHPITLYPVALGVLGVVGGGLFGLPIVLGAGFGGLLIGAGHFITNYYIRFDGLAREHIKSMHQATLKKLRDRPNVLRQEMHEIDFSRGIDQLDMAKLKFDEFLEALGRKFQYGELTHSRYSGVSETVYLSILDNLDLAIAKLNSVKSIHPEKLRHQIDDLQKTSNAERDIEALETRLALRVTAMEEVQKLLSQNEAALTVLDKTALKVAGIQTSKSGHVKDADLAMSELELLAARAADYEGK